jgi:hypothetical protein
MNWGTNWPISSYLTFESRWMSPVDVFTVRASNPAGQERKRWDTMDAKYNWIIDNVFIRIALNVVGFAVWLGAAYVLLGA